MRGVACDPHLYPRTTYTLCHGTLDLFFLIDMIVVLDAIYQCGYRTREKKVKVEGCYNEIEA